MSTLSSPITLRASRCDDEAAIAGFYPLAFPDEDLVPLLNELWQQPDSILSLVATSEDVAVGHAMFSYCTIAGDTASIALLGPVAVHPDHQSSGLGSQLITEGLNTLRNRNTAVVCVLGDPSYYSRFGFQPTPTLVPPYSPETPPAEWEGAWQSLALNSAGEHLGGRLRVPGPWDHEELWLP